MNPHLSYTDILAYIDSFNLVAYAKTRNHLTGAVSKLSPYITRGVISLPAVRERVLQTHSAVEAEKFIQELAWREYFQKVFTAKGEAIFSDLRFVRTDWRHEELVSAVVDGSTGIEVIDREIEMLYQTGYLHNHARMWVAMLACNVAQAHWKQMSRWMYYHLLDGDLASNTLSWQWVAGTSVQKPYLANQALINACSQSKQTGTSIDVERDMMGQGPVPDGLIASQPFSYTASYPTADRIDLLTGKTVFLYHPWAINPQWRAGEAGERIFIIEPKLFDAFPVSANVMEYMVQLARTHIPGVKVYVGNSDSLPGISEANVFSITHPTTKHFPGQKDAVEELFPQVQGYFPSFFSFWKACQKGS